MARTLQSDENPIQLQPKHKVGDEVTYINDYCVNWGPKTIIGIDFSRGRPTYFIEPTETPWVSIEEKNLHIPGTEPIFDLELNNGMTVKLVETDWNGNRYYDIEGKKAVLTDGFLHSIVGDWEEPCCRLGEQYQPKIA